MCRHELQHVQGAWRLVEPYRLDGEDADLTATVEEVAAHGTEVVLVVIGGVVRPGAAILITCNHVLTSADARWDSFVRESRSRPSISTPK
jgi:hypothetical protein